MATVQSSTKLTRALATLDANAERGDYDVDGRHLDAIAFFETSILGVWPENVLDLSATRIELGYTGQSIWGQFDFHLIFTGSGIGPVATLDALMEAIGDGLATGRINTVTLQESGDTLLTLTLSPGGYTMTSGVDVYRLTGAMPTTFAQMSELAGLLEQLDIDNIAMLPPSVRNAYFDDLSAYGLTGFSVETAGRMIMSLAITATGATAQMGELTVALTGQVPDNFGAIASLLYEVYAEFETLGQDIDLTELSGFGIDSLVISDNKGTELLRLNGPVSSSDSLTSHTVTGTAGNDVSDLEDLPFADVPALVVNLLGGNDTADFNLSSQYENAFFEGVPIAEQTQVTINGGAGTDLLRVTNYLFDAGVVINLGSGRIEGFNLNSPAKERVFSALVSGFEDVALIGSVSDVRGGAANETVRLSDAYWQSPEALSFDGGAGIDTLDLSGTFKAEEGYVDFPGVTRGILSANYALSLDGNGAVAFDRISDALEFPELRLRDVENLILKTATGTEVVSVASLMPTTYQVGSGGTFTGSYLSERITGTAGADLISGMGGADVLIGDLGNDTLQGGNGTDTLNGGTGDDFLFGGMGDTDLRDLVYGGDGNDSIDGGWGNDDLQGGNGKDTVLGGFGGDTVIGNDGNDVLGGGAGSDLMFGNAGNDTLNGGFGFDRMNGGTGADSFFHAGVADHASDWIQDYNAAEGDVLTVGLAGATRAQFQVNITTAPGAGSAAVAEAFIIYRPTGQILWALVDGGDDAVINANIGGQIFDLTA